MFCMENVAFGGKFRLGEVFRFGGISTSAEVEFLSARPERNQRCSHSKREERQRRSDSPFRRGRLIPLGLSASRHYHYTSDSFGKSHNGRIHNSPASHIKSKPRFAICQKVQIENYDFIPHSAFRTPHFNS